MTRRAVSLDSLPEYASDGELAAALMGERAGDFAALVPLLEKKNFPKVDPLFGGRPKRKVDDWLDWWLGRKKTTPRAGPAEDEPEDIAKWQASRPKRRVSGASRGQTGQSNIVGLPLKRPSGPASL